MATWAQYIPASLLVTGAALTFVTGTPNPTPLVRPLESTVTNEFLGVQGKEVKLGDDEVRVSGVSEYINREFDLGGNSPIALYVGYHATQQGEKGMHSPTLCLPGSGWVPVDSRLVSIPVEGRAVDVNRFVLVKQGQRILVYYWFQGRGRITTGEATLKLNAIKDAFLSHRDEETLVRIVIPIRKGELTDPVGATKLSADSLAVKLAAVAIPDVERALPPAP